VFVVARILFILFYLMDKALLRSTVWTIAIGAAIAMIVRSMQALG
jgi:uncharacterized MAPEG superfamily protein